MKEKMIKRICEIYKTMTYDGHKPEEGLEKARCMSAAFHELEDEMNKKEFKMEKEKKYTGYGYHGGGRKPTGIKRASIAVSGQPEELEQLKANAEAAGYATTSKFIIDMLVHKYPGITSQHSEDAE